ncbi:MAG TPA: DUF1559 domain-containing protein [Pirellulales bacterium]|nr:DUF1559 domain-containing protein [Pirellulales bacterium]
MCKSRASAGTWLLLVVFASGCGKSQPSGGAQDTVPAQQVIPGYLVSSTGPSGQAAIPGSVATPAQQPATGASIEPPQVVTGAAPATGSALTGPQVVSSGTNPAGGIPNATPGNDTQGNSPTVTGGQASPATSAPNIASATTATGTPAESPDDNPFAPAQPNATGGRANAVRRGNVPALAAAINQWRSQGMALAGAKRLDDKPVLAGYSWMTYLLPYLGHQDVYDQFDFTQGWHEKANLPLACEEIPAFLNPTHRNRRMTIVGVKNAIGPAFTHFVGMAGVEDTRNVVAAELPRSDPRAGIFGYDQIAQPADITDGTSNTILIISAGKIVGPWVSGGGATVRGARAPYFDDITGFSSVGDPKSGAVVALADGSVRRISNDIDPAVFRALCTMHGAEAIDFNANANTIRQE